MVVFDGKKYFCGNLRPLPPLEGGTLIQMKQKFLHNSRTNQANGTELDMWRFFERYKRWVLLDFFVDKNNTTPNLKAKQR